MIVIQRAALNTAFWLNARHCYVNGRFIGAVVFGFVEGIIGDGLGWTGSVGEHLCGRIR